MSNINYYSHLILTLRIQPWACFGKSYCDTTLKNHEIIEAPKNNSQVLNKVSNHIC